MDIRFNSRKLELIALDEDKLVEHCRENGAENPVKAKDEVLLALSQLEAAPNMHEIPAYFRPHPLTQDRRGQWGLDVTPKHRLILRPDHDDQPDFNYENSRSITKVVVLHLCKDYHKNKLEKL